MSASDICIHTCTLKYPYTYAHHRHTRDTYIHKKKERVKWCNNSHDSSLEQRSVFLILSTMFIPCFLEQFMQILTIIIFFYLSHWESHCFDFKSIIAAVTISKKMIYHSLKSHANQFIVTFFLMYQGYTHRAQLGLDLHDFCCTSEVYTTPCLLFCCVLEKLGHSSCEIPHLLGLVHCFLVLSFSLFFHFI